MNDISFDPSRTKAALDKALFGDPFLIAYAVVDGARCLDLLEHLDELSPPHACLFLGELDPEMEVVAPYLVELRRDDGFFDWLVDEGWGDGRGILMTSEKPLLDVRAHFRRLTLAEMPDGQVCWFRFYDPRVLRAFLPTCDEDQTAQMFGETVDSYLLENADKSLLTFRRPQAA